MVMQSRAGGNADKAGLALMVAGAGFFLGALGSAAVDWLWILVLVAFLALLYAIPAVHRLQAPADGPAGLWGTRLFTLGATVVVVLGVIFLIWEAVGDPPEEGGAIDVIWMIGFFSFLVGFVLFIIGSIRAAMLERAALWLVVIGLVGAVAIDMATGAFFEDENGTTTEWGFYLGVPLAGIGLAWMGSKLRARGEPMEGPPTGG